MKTNQEIKIPIGTKSFLLSKFYYGIVTKSLESLDIERYFTVIYFLSDNNGCTQQFICNNLHVDKTAMVKIIDYLIKTGMVDRNVNPNDRREHFIVLTKKGLRYADDILKTFNMLDEAMFSGISKEEQGIFLDVLARATENVKNMPANDLFFNFKKTGRKKRNVTNY